MIKTVIIVIFAVVLVGVIGVGVIVFLVTTPRRVKLQQELQNVTEYNYQTNLTVISDETLPEFLQIRRLRDSEWENMGEHTQYKVEHYIEPSMFVQTVKLDGWLGNPDDENHNILLGRISDRGSGSHGWHVTMIKQGENPIRFDKHVRYRVWIEKDFPIGFNDAGEPFNDSSKRWYFSGLADMMDKELYVIYEEPEEGDR